MKIVDFLWMNVPEFLVLGVSLFGISDAPRQCVAEVDVEISSRDAMCTSGVFEEKSS